MSSVNRYPAVCEECGCTVPANGGTLTKDGRRWIVRHLACPEGAGAGGVYEITFESGESITRNRRGLCIDAPCCGCCTF